MICQPFWLACVAPLSPRECDLMSLLSFSRPFVLHDCGTKVQLYSDGWGFCPKCRTEFHGTGRPVVQP